MSINLIRARVLISVLLGLGGLQDLLLLLRHYWLVVLYYQLAYVRLGPAIGILIYMAFIKYCVFP